MVCVYFCSCSFSHLHAFDILILTADSIFNQNLIDSGALQVKLRLLNIKQYVVFKVCMKNI